MRRARQLAWVVSLLLLAGCNVGPDYQPLEPELPATFVEAQSDVDADLISLWAAFDDPEVAALIARARTHNATVAQAAATMNETRALAGLPVYSLFPTVTAAASTERVQQSAQDPFGFGSDVAERALAGFDATWEIDLFGSLRRQSAGIARRLEADTAAFYATQVSVVAETAQAYFEWRGASLRVDLLARNLQNQADNLEILERAFDSGRGSSLDIARARAEERSVAATLPAAEAARSRAEQRLAVLTGQNVSALRLQLSAPEQMPAMPQLVAVGAPAQWLARRPDIVAAERRLAEATMGIGVQTAELYQKLVLIGDFGWTGARTGALGDDEAERWRFAPGLTWRIFDYGRIKQRIRQSEAIADRALAVFEQTWREAIEETENALASYRATTATVAALQEAVTQSADAVRLANQRYDNGADSVLSVLDSQRTDLSLQDQLALATTDRATALAALYKAMGGSFAAATGDN